jgi:hypothetical protein
MVGKVVCVEMLTNASASRSLRWVAVMMPAEVVDARVVAYEGYAETLGIALRPQADGRPMRLDSIPQPGPASAGSSALQNVDSVQIIVFRQPSCEPVPSLWAGNRPIDTLQPTRGRAVNHIAFSYRRIEPVFDRL